MEHIALKLVRVLLLPACVLSAAPSMAACVQARTDAGADGRTVWTLTNECTSPVDVRLRSTGKARRVCAEMRIDPGERRRFAQQAVCGSANQLIEECVCETRIDIAEHSSE